MSNAKLFIFWEIWPCCVGLLRTIPEENTFHNINKIVNYLCKSHFTQRGDVRMEALNMKPKLSFPYQCCADTAKPIMSNRRYSTTSLPVRDMDLTEINSSGLHLSILIPREHLNVNDIANRPVADWEQQGNQSESSGE